MNAKPIQPEWAHLGVVAGGGALPSILAHAARLKGKPVHVASLRDQADQDWDGFNTQDFALDEIAGICAYFKAAGVDAVTFAGNVRRPDFETFQARDLGAAQNTAIYEAAHKGDDALLRSVIALFEKAGFLVIGLREIAPENLVQVGGVGNLAAMEHAKDDCLQASHIARKIGAMDIGQGAVVCRGVVMAVEAQEGTAAMLERCAHLPADLRGSSQNRSGVFAKWAKPDQDRRIDLPVIGVSTIEAVARIGLAGLVLEAGAVILLEPDAIIKAIDRLGLFLLGQRGQG